jgi:hypothetical protein
VGIDFDSYAALHEVCTAHALNGNVEDDLFRVANLLHEWRLTSADERFTAARQAAALKRIETLTAALEKEIEVLSSVSRFLLEDEYFQNHDRSLFGVIRAADTSPLHADVGAVRRIRESVTVLLQELPEPTGRPAVAGMQAEFISFIARYLQPAGVKPSNSGAFRSLCAAVFQAAGLTLPASALKQFVKTSRSI